MQQLLFDTPAPLRRVHLDDDAWVDYAPGWLENPGPLFERLRDRLPWRQRTRRLFEREVVEPRLTARWTKGEPLEPVLAGVLQSLDTRYEKTFDSIGFNFYRDGNDSVAMHRDTISKEINQPIVALISLGHPRRFLLRPYAGGKGMSFELGPGDLLVTGGDTQRTWLHGIPKVVQAGPRISLAFRYGLERSPTQVY